MSAWLAVHASHRALGVAVVAAFVAIGCAAGGGATIAPSTTSPSAVPEHSDARYSGSHHLDREWVRQSLREPAYPVAGCCHTKHRRKDRHD